MFGCSFRAYFGLFEALRGDYLFAKQSRFDDFQPITLRFTRHCTGFGRISGTWQGCDVRSMETDRTAELFWRPHPARLKTKH